MDVAELKAEYNRLCGEYEKLHGAFDYAFATLAVIAREDADLRAWQGLEDIARAMGFRTSEVEMREGRRQAERLQRQIAARLDEIRRDIKPPADT
jgi:hypothetical protein